MKEKSRPKKSQKNYKSLIRVLKWGSAVTASVVFGELVVLLNVNRSQIQFHKNEDVYIECFTKWTDTLPEAVVTHSDLFNGKRLDVQHISGQVDITKVGEYVLTYKAKFWNKEAETTRTVYVVDRTPPEIELKTNPDYFVTDFFSYKEEGFVARDNHDGDISDKVIAENCGESILYTVKDESGNQTSVVRQIPFKDVEPPAITLNGTKHMYIQKGTDWVDPGYLVVDNYDVEVTQTYVDNTINKDVLGDYSVKYIAEDAAGNVSEVERIVSVIDKNADNMIYLTFDDGPSPYTMELLDVLDKYNIKATFFVVNNDMSDIITEIANRGHVVGAHTYSHKYKIYKNEPEYYQDLNKILDVIEEKTGTRTNLIRFPGGSSNTISRNYCANIMTQLAESVKRKGYQYFDWTVNSGDADEATTRQEVFNNVVAGIRETKRPVVLQHDIKDYSVAATEDIIKWALENGYVFGVLDEEIVCHHSILN